MKKILLVDDSKLLRTANARILAKAGYEVLTAADGEEGLKIVQSQVPDLLVLDMMLPKLSGVEVLQAVRKNPSTQALPVIVLTSLSEMNRKKIMAEGATDFVEKSKGLTDQNSSALLQAIARVFQKG
ncbi:MAG TPA: response regulator [Terriglobales bacterium]|jgi:CheY-like chemotaxis protein|nr:response regulator [Terriglobales bacterium]